MRSKHSNRKMIEDNLHPVVLFLSAQFRTKSPLQFGYDLLIGNCFSRFVFLYDLGFLVYNLHHVKSIRLCTREWKMIDRNLELYEHIKHRYSNQTWASWACVSFLSIRACMIAFFNSVGTFSSVITIRVSC